MVAGPGYGHEPPARWTMNEFVIWAAGVRGEASTLSYLRSLNEWVIQDEIVREEVLKKSGKRAQARKEVPFNGFVNLGLNSERKSAVNSWKVDWEGVITLFSEVVADDYRVSFSPANSGEAVQVSLTCRDQSSTNAGWCMTSRAPTWQDALRVAMWKHFVLCDRDWSEYLEGDVADDWG